MDHAAHPTVASHVDTPGEGQAPTRRQLYAKPAAYGLLAASALLVLYFGALSLISGWSFTVSEFQRYWYFVIPLAVGFGVQFGLFVRLRALVGQSKESGTVVATSGTTSTAAMISCCAHYLVNVAPVLGATGLVAFAAQFQVQLFWVGLAFNVAGIAFVLNRVLGAEKEHAKCAV